VLDVKDEFSEWTLLCWLLHFEHILTSFKRPQNQSPFLPALKQFRLWSMEEATAWQQALLIIQEIDAQKLASLT